MARYPNVSWKPFLMTRDVTVPIPSAESGMEHPIWSWPFPDLPNTSILRQNLGRVQIQQGINPDSTIDTRSQFLHTIRIASTVGPGQG